MRRELRDAENVQEAFERLSVDGPETHDVKTVEQKSQTGELRNKEAVPPSKTSSVCSRIRHQHQSLSVSVQRPFRSHFPSTMLWHHTLFAKCALQAKHTHLDLGNGVQSFGTFAVRETPRLIIERDQERIDFDD